MGDGDCSEVLVVAGMQLGGGEWQVTGTARLNSRLRVTSLLYFHNSDPPPVLPATSSGAPTSPA